MKWILVAEITEALRALEEHSNWDLSSGETAALLECFYEELSVLLLRKLTGTAFANGLELAFEKAYKATWGNDHECDVTKPSELSLFAECLLSSCMEAYHYTSEEYFDCLTACKNWKLK